MPHRILGGHPDSAVQLDGLLRDVSSGPSDLQLGPRGDNRVESAVGDRHGGIEAHASRQFQRNVHVGGSLGQGLEVAQRHAELLAFAEIPGGQLQRFLHRADGFGAQSRLVPDHGVRNVVSRVTAGAQRFGDHGVEVELGCPSTVEGAVRVPRRCGAVDEEQPCSPIGESSGHDHLVGRITCQHRVFAAGDRPGVAASFCLGVELTHGNPHARLIVREGQEHRTLGDVVENRLLLIGARFGDQTAGNERCLRNRFRREPPADLGHDDHDLDGAGFVRIESKAEQAHFGELTPHLAVPSAIAFDDFVVARDVIVARQQVAGDIAQQLLLLCQIEVHYRLTIPEWSTR